MDNNTYNQPKKIPSVLMGIPNGSGVMPSIMVQSLLQLHKPIPCAVMIVERQMILKARNAIALEALKNNFDYLFFVDDDNPIPTDTLEKLLECDKDIVIAPILSRNPNKDGKHDLCAFYSEELEGVVIDGKPLRIYKNITDFRDTGHLHKIDAGGTGCMLIKRKVLEALHTKYKDYIFENGDIRFPKTVVGGIEYDRRTMSEDCEFCERAVDAGFEVWLDERVRPIHLTQMGAVKWGNNG